jgi:hypothetical protein
MPRLEPTLLLLDQAVDALEIEVDELPGRHRVASRFFERRFKAEYPSRR